MSLIETQRRQCPSCQHTFEAEIARSVNVTRAPWLRARVLSGELGRLRCPRCGATHELDDLLLYADLSGPCLVMAHPLAQLGQWRRCEELTLESLGDALTGVPVDVDVLMASATLRCVFGRDALIEKLRLWDAGLDDAIVELLKLELFTTLAREAGGRDADGAVFDRRLLVTEVDLDADALTVEARPWRPGAGDGVAVSASLARYRALLSRRATLAERYPRLFFGPWVSFRRLAAR